MRVKVEPTTLTTGTSVLSSQQRLLENELKLPDGTNRVGEGGLQMREGLEQRIVVSTIWRPLSGAQAHPQHIRSPAQSLEEMINRLQGRRRLDLVKDRTNGGAAQKSGQQLPEHGGGDRVAR